MAVLKDTTVSGNIRVTDTVLADTVQANTIKVRSSSDSETLSAGTDGQVLTTDGTNAYWGDATTYSNLAAASGGTDLSLVTTGEKYTWNNKTSNTGTVTSVTINATSPIAIDSNSAITTSGTRTVSHANSGVTAGTYRSVTVNATGHVTSGSNPTTLSGYGITDAENTGNKVTSISSSSTDDEYPSAKAVYNAIPDAVEANPTVPSGTTPTSLTGVKVGSSYYSIDGGVSDVTVGGSSVVNNNGVAVIPSIPDATGKADKVASATNGHLAGLDSNGNLTDSGMGIDNIPTANSNNVVKSGGIYDALATPKIAEKIYTDTFASSSSYSVHCFLKVLSNDWSKIHTIRFKVKAWIPDVSNSTAISDVTLQIYQGVVKAYYIKNAIANTDYRPYYSLYYYGTTSTGFSNNVPELIGIYINSANTYSYTTKRNYIVQVINADGCTFEFFDNDCNVSTAKGDYNSSTYYLSAATYNTYTAGLQETSDTNTTYSVISNDELRTGTATSSRTVSAARLAANYNISTDSTTGVSTIRIGANTISPEVVSNKVTSLSSSSTDTEYPSAKCVYDELEALNEALNAEPFDARSEYLTIEALENSTEVYFGLRHNRGSVKTIYISTDKETWTSKTSSLMSTGNHGTLLATLSKGQKLYLRGDNNGYGNYYTEDGDTMYTGNTIYVSKYNFIYGNLFSLINSTNFSTMTQLSYGTCAFTCLFYGNTYLLSHPYKRLVIPLTYTYTTEAIFQYMFTNCRNLSVGPEFGYASTKSDVQGMFYGCYKLKYIKYTCNNSWGFDNSYFGEDNIKYCVYEDSIDLSRLPPAQIYIKASEEPKNLASVVAIQAINELKCEPDWNVANEYRPGYIKNKPTIPAISTDIAADKASTIKTAAPSAVYNEVHPAIVIWHPPGGFLPNVVYDIGTVSGSFTFALASATDNTIANAYYWTFETGTTAPTITWPANITWAGGSAPEIYASKHYEIMIRNGYGTYIEI